MLPHATGPHPPTHDSGAPSVAVSPTTASPLAASLVANRLLRRGSVLSEPQYISATPSNGSGRASPAYYGSMSPTRSVNDSDAENSRRTSSTAAVDLLFSSSIEEQPSAFRNNCGRGFSEPPSTFGGKKLQIGAGASSCDDVYLHIVSSSSSNERGPVAHGNRLHSSRRRRIMDAKRTPSGRAVRVRGVAYTFVKNPRPYHRRRNLGPGSRDGRLHPRVRSASCDVLAVEPSDDFSRNLSESKSESEEEESSGWGGIVALCSDWKRMSVLVSIAIADFTSFLCLSIMAPFFPAEASARGVSQSTSGLIFSCYALVCFLVSPTMGKMMPRLGSKFMFVSGTFVSGACCVLFGFLDRIEGKTEFIALCFVVRCMEAVGAAAFATAGFALVAEIFPDNIGGVMGTMETFVGLGLSIGPAIGGALYDLDGYHLPFLVLGTFMLMTVPLNMVLLPPDKREAPVMSQLMKSPNGDIRKAGMFDLLKEPRVAMVCCAVIVLSADWSYLDPTLQPHLEQFELSANQLGLLFLLASGTYAFSSPIWGWASDKWNNGWNLVSSGLVFLGVILMFLGPSPWIPYLPETLWLNVLCLGLMGMTIAWGLVPTFQMVLDAATDAGYEETLATYSLVSGVWASVYSLGEVIGPALGGLLMDNYGFGVSSTVFGVATISLGIVMAVFTSVCINGEETEGGVQGFVEEEERELGSGSDDEKGPLKNNTGSRKRNGGTNGQESLDCIKSLGPAETTVVPSKSHVASRGPYVLLRTDVPVSRSPSANRFSQSSVLA